MRAHPMRSGFPRIAIKSARAMERCRGDATRRNQDDAGRKMMTQAIAQCQCCAKCRNERRDP